MIVAAIGLHLYSFDSRYLTSSTAFRMRPQFFWKTSLAMATADTALGQPE